MTYRLNEFQFQLPPSELLDATINILKFPELGTSLIVSRSLLTEGETLQSNLDDQLKRLEKNRSRTCAANRAPPCAWAPTRKSKPSNCAASSTRAMKKVFQFQLALVLPGTRKMLALSYVKAEKLGDAEAAHWATIKGSLLFDVLA
nr:hypothetical protein GCM10020185_34760 [Pseudomonas brassicacearum subsp. brassicacearum]